MARPERRSVNADEVRRRWAACTTEYSPGYYAYYGPNETSEQIHRALADYVDHDTPILELGCSAGRHLWLLHQHGFTALHGVDINEDAFDVMADEYPALAAAGTFYRDAIEHLVTELDDGAFGAVYSVEVLQHIHDDETWLFEELVRVTDDVLVTVECEELRDGDWQGGTAGIDGEGLPLHPRRWEAIFTGLGLEQVRSRAMGRNTLRVFRHP